MFVTYFVLVGPCLVLFSCMYILTNTSYLIAFFNLRAFLKFLISLHHRTNLMRLNCFIRAFPYSYLIQIKIIFSNFHPFLFIRR